MIILIIILYFGVFGLYFCALLDSEDDNGNKEDNRPILVNLLSAVFWPIQFVTFFTKLSIKEVKKAIEWYIHNGSK